MNCKPPLFPPAFAGRCNYICVTPVSWGPLAFIVQYSYVRSALFVDLFSRCCLPLNLYFLFIRSFLRLAICSRSAMLFVDRFILIKTWKCNPVLLPERHFTKVVTKRCSPSIFTDDLQICAFYGKFSVLSSFGPSFKQQLFLCFFIFFIFFGPKVAPIC